MISPEQVDLSPDERKIYDLWLLSRRHQVTLLTAMETAARLSRKFGRHEEIGGLRPRALHMRSKRDILCATKSLEATAKGIRLIEVVHPEVKSPAMTAVGKLYPKRDPVRTSCFCAGLYYVRDVIGKVAQIGGAARNCQGRGARRRIRSGTDRTALRFARAPKEQRRQSWTRCSVSPTAG